MSSWPRDAPDSGRTPGDKAAARTVLLGAWALVQAGTAVASNWSFLENSAIARFGEEDIRLMIENAEAVAEDPKTPMSRSWRNAASGHSGIAEALAAFAGPDRVPCKKLRITNIAGERRGSSTYTVCKFPGCGWLVIARDAPKDLELALDCYKVLQQQLAPACKTSA